MQLQQLRYFLAVAEVRHFTRAAEQLRVAQPSLSKQVGALERELGAPLFSRARGNIALTAAGEALLPLARRIIADVDTARREVQDLTGLRRGRVRLGATPSLCAGLLGDVLAGFRHQYPGIELFVTEGGSRDLVRDLGRGQLDLALVILPLHLGDAALETLPILREELVVATRGPFGHRKAGSGPAGSGAVGSGPAGSGPVSSGPVSSGPGGSGPVRPRTSGRGRFVRIEELAERPLVMFRSGYDLREATLAACRAAGFEPRFAVEGGEMDAVLRFVEAGLGPAVVPSMVLADRPGLTGTPLAPPGLQRTIALAHRKDVHPTHAATAFRTTLLEFVAEAADLPPGVETIPNLTR